MTAVLLPAQSFTVLHSFDLSDGAAPESLLIQSTNGNLWGTTNSTVFEIAPSGTLTTVASGGFDSYGNEALVEAASGDYYGMTVTYGGSIFRLTPTGGVTVLHTFCIEPSCADGSVPYGPLVQAPNGNFYGTTSEGGLYNEGTVFKITPSGVLTTLYTFCSAGPPCTDGASPRAALIQFANGDFYGTTSGGGYNPGTVFKITPSGVLTTLHSFDGTDGQYPGAGLIQAANGNFYGTTVGGGNYGCGTFFKMTPSGALTTLSNFDSTDGCQPWGVVQGTDGNFYGTTVDGGTGMSGINVSSGTIFRITPVGALTTLHNFCSKTNCTDGEVPQAGLVQDTTGSFYGTTEYGGANDYGTVFRFSIGLPPFVETQTTFGAVGAAVTILGTNLTGATSVTFNGTAAVFDVVSGSEITTTVPDGAATGKIEVVTPGGTLSTKVPYTVLP
jgi:uncharacterized repeat protein (TIGR03803 family)